GGPAAAVALLDWDGDGRLDVVAAGEDGGRVLLNDGARGFTAGPELPVDGVRAALAVDVDGDGALDLVVAGAGGTRLIRRDLTQARLHAADASGVATADFNGDGRADLAVVDASKRAVHVLTNGPDVSAATFNSSGGIAGVAAADATGDGAPDLLLALDGSDRAPPANVVLVNALNGLFERGASFGQSATSAVRAADVNGDGYVDAVAINASGRDRKSTRLNSSHVKISYAVFCLKKKTGHQRA